MFTEFKGVLQEPGGRRRWFEGDGLELIVWYDPNNAIVGFQLCYDRDGRQWALTWRPVSGFAHDVVLTGDTTPFKNQTPTLEPEGKAPWTELTQRFRREAAGLEAPLREFVVARIAEESSK